MVTVGVIGPSPECACGSVGECELCCRAGCCHVHGLRQPTKCTSFTACPCGACSCALDTCKQQAVDEDQFDSPGQLSVPFSMCISQCMAPGSSLCHNNCQLQPRGSEAVTVQSALLTLAEVLTGGTWRCFLLSATGGTGSQGPACRTDRCSSSNQQCVSSEATLSNGFLKQPCQQKCR